jgi:hypothetical protein
VLLFPFAIVALMVLAVVLIYVLAVLGQPVSQ